MSQLLKSPVIMFRQLIYYKPIFYISISVLEFELRKAHETIKALRGSLTEATGKSDYFQMLFFSKIILKFVTLF